jgi:WXG100 family type VII secretion target
MSIEIQIKYLAMRGIAHDFEDAVGKMKKLLTDVEKSYQPLKGGGWQADSADDFYKSMDTEVFPALDRLNKSLAKAVETCEAIATTYQKAEESAKDCIPNL